MSSTTDGSIFIFSSPSGAGKTTLVKLVSKKENFTISISHTTRKPRSNEVNGKDYHFVDDKTFQSLIKQKEFLEYAKVFDNYYGTSRSPVIKNLSEGINILFDIDWQGSKQIKSQSKNFNIFSFFVLPPSKEVLFERLSNRDMKDKLIASERMIEVIENIISSKKKISFDKQRIEKHVEKLIS